MRVIALGFQKIPRTIILFTALVRLCAPLGLQADLYSDFEESGAVPSAPSAVVGGYAVFVEGDGAYLKTRAAMLAV